MAEVHCAGFAGCKYFRSAGGFFKALRQFHERHTNLARWSQDAGYIQMRTHSNPRGGIVAAHIGEEKQHQQSTSFGAHIHTPREE